MVDLNPVLRCLLVVEETIERGETVRDGLLGWLDAEGGRAPSILGESNLHRVFRRQILEFLRAHEAREDDFLPNIQRTMPVVSAYRQSFFLILAAGVSGQPILPSLRDLRVEIESQLELDMKAHVESLPLKMLVPLLLCMFPAFLILLLGPITRNFLEVFK